MNWTLILDYFRALIWPGIAVALLIMFRQQIRAWLGRPPSALELPGGLGRLEWPPAQQEAPETDPDEALAPFEGDDFVEALRELLREEVGQAAQQDRQALIEGFVREQVNLQVALDFERIFNRIFGSQVRLLEWVHGSGGLTRDQIAAYFAGQQRAAPALAPWTLDQYLQFLLVNDLIRPDADRFVITEKGQAFLGYLQVNGYISGARTL